MNSDQNCSVLSASKALMGKSVTMGNSLVLFYPLGSVSNGPTAGSIRYIFVRDDKVWLAVQCQVHALTSIINLFSRYPDFPAEIYSTTLNLELEPVDLA